MDLQDVMEVVTILAYIPRFLGLFVFGAGAGWLCLHLLGRYNGTWQVEAVYLICFFGLAGAALFFTTPAAPGALGAYTLGAGAALLFWGLRGQPQEKNSDN